MPRRRCGATGPLAARGSPSRGCCVAIRCAAGASTPFPDVRPRGAMNRDPKAEQRLLLAVALSLIALPGYRLLFPAQAPPGRPQPAASVPASSPAPTPAPLAAETPPPVREAGPSEPLEADER